MGASQKALFELQEVLGIGGEKEPSGLEKVLSDFYSIDNIEMKTDLSKRQINSIARAKVFIEKYKSKYMKQYINNIMILSISKTRQGRKEWGEIARQNYDFAGGGRSLSDRLFGR